jgi:hypothetical protein
LLHTFAYLGLEFNEGNEQIGTHCNPNLSHDRVACCTNKTLDLQVLFYPFEKQFNLPARLAVGELSKASAPVEILDGFSMEIRNDVLNRTGIQLAGTIFIAKGSMPRTSSGKIRRSTCRSRYLDSEFTIVHESFNPVWKDSIMQMRQQADRVMGASLIV